MFMEWLNDTLLLSYPESRDAIASKNNPRNKNKIYLICKKYTIAIVLGPVSIVPAKFHSVSHHSLREDWLFGWTKCRVSQCCLNGSLNSSDRKMVEAEKLVPDHCCYEYYSKKQNS